MWTYQQATGALHSAAGECVAHGYSRSPEGKNDPAKQSLANVGPVPRGGYSIGAPFDSETHGPYCLRLDPDAANEMFGRSGFLMHGDSVAHPGAASEGCIILPRPVRELVWASDDHRLEVVE